MALTQKKVKEEITRIEQLIADTATEKNELLNEIKKMRDESSDINLASNDEIMEKVDSYNGLKETIKYFNGYLDSLSWTLKEMKTKK